MYIEPWSVEEKVLTEVSLSRTRPKCFAEIKFLHTIGTCYHIIWLVCKMNSKMSRAKESMKFRSKR